MRTLDRIFYPLPTGSLDMMHAKPLGYSYDCSVTSSAFREDQKGEGR
jgi:hypothetical protein